MKTLTLLTSSIASAIALAACGGGGDSTSSGTGLTGGSPGSNSSQTTQVASYEVQPVATDADSFLALLNSEGARGYYYLRSWTFADGAKSIFMNLGTGLTYTCEMPDPGGFLAQANTEGAKSYTFLTTSFSNNFYCQNSQAVAQQDTYSYAGDVVPGSTSIFLNQLNQWGQSGYLTRGELYNTSTQIVSQTLYEKVNASTTPTYINDVQAMPTDLSDFTAQLNSEGAQGYRARLLDNLALNSAPYNTKGSGVNIIIYTKDQSQSATFTYLTDILPKNSSDFITQADNYAAQGYQYTNSGTLSGQSILFYIKENN